MNSRSLTLLLSIFLLVGCKRSDFRRDSFLVTEIVSGNEIQLINGYSVKLIGIEDNEKTKNYLRSALKKGSVRFVFDSKVPYLRIHPKSRDKSFYAYVVLEGTGVCINSDMLSKEISDLSLSPTLNDSLTQYISYSGFEEKIIQEEREQVVRTGCEVELDKLIVASDYSNPITRDFAVKNAARSPGEFSIDQVIEIFLSLRTNWNYVNDPAGAEFFSKASRTIANTDLSGDCDDFAILMYSLISAIGGEARISFAWGAQGGHAFAEVNVSAFSMEKVKRTISRRFPGYDISQLFYESERDGKWLNLDWWAHYPGGPYFDYSEKLIFYPKENRCRNGR